MSASAQNLLSLQSYPENISILLVSPHEADQLSLRQILHHSKWRITRAQRLQEAAESLRANPPSVVVCERDLPDGTWLDLFQSELFHQPAPVVSAPPVLVASRQADENLWSEVLTLGGYDVLEKPFDPSEVTRIVGMAWRCWWSLRYLPSGTSAMARPEPQLV